MMPAHRFHPSHRLLAACCLLALSGCASEALNAQLATSREAVDQARIAGAAETAPAELDAATDKLNRAAVAARNRHKKDAMRLAREAQVDANLARARTDSSQARMAAAEITKSNQLLYEELNRLKQNQRR